MHELLGVLLAYKGEKWSSQKVPRVCPRRRKALAVDKAGQQTAIVIGRSLWGCCFSRGRIFVVKRCSEKGRPCRADNRTPAEDPRPRPAGGAGPVAHQFRDPLGDHYRRRRRRRCEPAGPPKPTTHRLRGRARRVSTDRTMPNIAPEKRTSSITASDARAICAARGRAIRIGCAEPSPGDQATFATFEFRRDHEVS